MQRGDHHRLSPPRHAGQGVGDRRGQHRMRRQLHKRALTDGQQPRHTVMKPDRLPQVGIPVTGVHGGGVQRITRDRAGTVEYSGTRAGRGLRPGQLAQQLLTQWFDLSRMRRVIHRDGPDVDASRSQASMNCATAAV